MTTELRDYTAANPAGAIDGADLLYLVQAGASKGATVTALAAFILALVVDGAPAALDTLNELAAALGDDPNFVTTITTLLAAANPESENAVIAQRVFGG